MKHTCDDQLVMLAELPSCRSSRKKRDDFLDYTVQNLAISRSATGNIAFAILLDEARPDQVLFYEVWETAEAQQAYMAWRVERDDLTILLSFLAGESKFTALQRIAR